MKRITILSLFVLVTACGETPTGSTEEVSSDPAFGILGNDPHGAIVLNRGEPGEPFTFNCFLAGRLTTNVTVVRNPTGGGLLTCRWTPWPTTTVFSRAFRASGFGCFLNFFGFTVTTETNFVIARTGDVATLTCRFREMPTVTSQCYGQIASGIASTWPWAHDDKIAFPPPPGSLHLWIETFGPLIGISTVRELQLLFCGS